MAPAVRGAKPTCPVASTRPSRGPAPGRRAARSSRGSKGGRPCAGTRACRRRAHGQASPGLASPPEGA
eukprot:1328362-Alexandrium_andersonii.AAC.1